MGHFSVNPKTSQGVLIPITRGLSKAEVGIMVVNMGILVVVFFYSTTKITTFVA